MGSVNAQVPRPGPGGVGLGAWGWDTDVGARRLARAPGLVRPKPGPFKTPFPPFLRGFVHFQGPNAAHLTSAGSPHQPPPTPFPSPSPFPSPARLPRSQVDKVCGSLAGMPELEGGFNMVGFSQGGQFLRVRAGRGGGGRLPQGGSSAWRDPFLALSWLPVCCLFRRRRRRRKPLQRAGRTAVATGARCRAALRPPSQPRTPRRRGVRARAGCGGALRPQAAAGAHAHHPGRPAPGQNPRVWLLGGHWRGTLLLLCCRAGRRCLCHQWAAAPYCCIPKRAPPTTPQPRRHDRNPRPPPQGVMNTPGCTQGSAGTGWAAKACSVMQMLLGRGAYAPWVRENVIQAQ